MASQLVHFDKINKTVQGDISYQLISHATLFAAIKHTQQKRKDPDGTPHTLMTIGGLVPSANDLQKKQSNKVLALPAILAAILHDTIEDTDTTPEEIEKEFGSLVKNVVLEVTDDKSLSKEARKLKQVETAPYKSREAKAVKLADKLYNLRDLIRVAPRGWTRERIQEYFMWSKKVVDGCRGTLPSVEAELDKLFDNATFVYDGKAYDCLPKSNV